MFHSFDEELSPPVTLQKKGKLPESFVPSASACPRELAFFLPTADLLPHLFGVNKEQAPDTRVRAAGQIIPNKFPKSLRPNHKSHYYTVIQ